MRAWEVPSLECKRNTRRCPTGGSTAFYSPPLGFPWLWSSIGYALPGSFQALGATKALVVQVADQAMIYTTDQKTTHYAHILPPRSICLIQLWATLVNGLVCLGVMQFQFSINDICTKHNAMKFSCPNETTLFSASIIWGLVGPKRIFDHQYPVLKWMFLRGAGVGFVFWAVQFAIPQLLLLNRYPHKTKQILRYQRIVTKAHPLIIVNGFLGWTPYNLTKWSSRYTWPWGSTGSS